MFILSPEEIRAQEEKHNNNGLSFEEMMENAGRGCAEHILKNYSDMKNAVIFVGKGKNGGDGFVIARYLSENGVKVNIIKCFNSPSDSLSEKNKERIDGICDIFVADKITNNIRNIIENADIIIDAVFGIGFKGNLPENVISLFSQAKKSKALKIAIDIPSGLSFENENTDNAFPADETLSMLCFKREHIYSPWKNFCGKVTVIPIGFDVEEGYLKACSVSEIKNIIPKRPFNANKGTFGKALLIAGSYSMPGAGIIAAKGALSSGTGLLYFCFPDCIYSSVTAQLSECVMKMQKSDENGTFSKESIKNIIDEINFFSAIAIGPGFTTHKNACELLYGILKNYSGKLIIDADGINIVSRNINVLKDTNADIIMTPHPGEMSRLTNKSISEIQNDREKIASEFAKEFGVTLLLKGVNTVIASENGEIFINSTGSTALSRGGSGDLLTGIILGLLSMRADTLSGTVAGAFIHGLSGEEAEKKYTAYSSTVEKISDCIPVSFKKILSGM